MEISEEEFNLAISLSRRLASSNSDAELEEEVEATINVWPTAPKKQRAAVARARPRQKPHAARHLSFDQVLSSSPPMSAEVLIPNRETFEQFEQVARRRTMRARPVSKLPYWMQTGAFDACERR